MTKKTTMQEYEPFMDKTVKINGIDGKTEELS